MDNRKIISVIVVSVVLFLVPNMTALVLAGTTLPTIPGPPLASLNPNNGNFTLTWTVSTITGGIANYELQRSSDNGFTFITIANSTTNNYTENDLLSGGICTASEQSTKRGTRARFLSPVREEFTL